MPPGCGGSAPGAVVVDPATTLMIGCAVFLAVVGVDLVVARVVAPVERLAVVVVAPGAKVVETSLDPCVTDEVDVVVSSAPATEVSVVGVADFLSLPPHAASTKLTPAKTTTA